jgi:hypothetical protein
VAFAKASADIRRYHGERTTEEDFRCLVYHYLRRRLTTDLLGAQESIPLEKPNRLDKKTVFSDLTLGTKFGVTEVIVEIKLFWGLTGEQWRRRRQGIREDSFKLREVIKLRRNAEGFPDPLCGFVLVPMLCRGEKGFDKAILRNARGMVEKYEKKYGISILVN